MSLNVAPVGDGVPSRVNAMPSAASEGSDTNVVFGNAKSFSPVESITWIAFPEWKAICPSGPHEGWRPVWRSAAPAPGFEGSMAEIVLTQLTPQARWVYAIRLSPGVCDQLGSVPPVTKFGKPPADEIVSTKLPPSKSSSAKATCVPSSDQVGWLSPPLESSSCGVPNAIPDVRSTLTL